MKLTYNDVETACEEIASRFYGKNITRVVGIARGGLIPAIILSHKLDCDFESIKLQTRDFKDSFYTMMNLKSQLLELGNFQTTLFVDDICDSGKTIKIVRNLVPDAKFVTIVSKIDGVVDFSPMPLVDYPHWIDFPWETYNSNR